MTLIKNVLTWLNSYAATVFCIGLGLAFFLHQLERPNLKTPDDVLQLEGKVIDYSFKLKSGYRATSRQYYIWLDNYPCTFQIKADFLPYFNQKKFEKEVKAGDIIKLTIPKEFKNQIENKNSTIFILSTSKNSNTFLSLDETIPQENNKFDIYIGLLFITIGVVYYIVKKKGIIK